MVDTKAAKRYSSALFALALNAQAVEAIENDLRTVAESISQTPEFMAVMLQPKIPGESKKAILRRAFEGRVADLVLDFLCLLVDRKRIHLLQVIVSDFAGQVNAWRNVVIAQVTTALPMTEEENRMFINRLGQLTGKAVQLVADVDPSIIAGARVHIGGKMIDGTVVTHLERLRERLKQVRVV